MIDCIQVPTFARLSDYLGAWACEPMAFAGLSALAKGMDLHAHVAARPEPLRSSVQTTGAGDHKIAVVALRGILMKGQSSLGGTSTVQLRRDIRQAVADPAIGGILLHVDSPGGTVAGTADLAADVRAAAKVKPTWSYIEDLGASAAYWVASQATKVIANAPTALVGSIGTLQVVTDTSEANSRAGIRTLVFSTGLLKGLGTPGAPVTDEQAAHLQSLIDAVQVAFDQDVKRGRGLMSAELAAVRHGGVMLAPAAEAASLIDGVMPLTKVLADLGREIGNHTVGTLPMRKGAAATQATATFREALAEPTFHASRLAGYFGGE